MNSLKFHAGLLALFIALFSSCQVTPEDSPLPPQAALAVIVGNNAWDCISKGQQYAFNLEHRSPGQAGGSIIPPGMAYYVYLGNVPSYDLEKNCMCRLQHYSLEFDFLPATSQIELSKLDGTPIPFSGPQTTPDGKQALKISQRYLDTGMLIGFDPALPSQPSLHHAGGICIVDNISAPLPLVQGDPIRDHVYYEMVYDEELDTEYATYFLPTSQVLALP